MALRHFCLFFLLCACVIFQCVAVDLPDKHHAAHSILTRKTETAPLLANSTTSAVEAARKVVKNAIAKAALLNKARLRRPGRNHFSLAPGTVVGDRTIRKKRSDAYLGITPSPLLDITPEIAAAAALVAEADAQADGGPSQAVNKRSSFWMESISRLGSSPWGGDSSYQVFRNVKDYGAKGDGKTDDTKAIWQAISDGKRCANGCNGASTTNAIVYFPAGTYLVSTNITVLFGTQMIGDATDRPTIKAASSFVGLGVLSTDVYVGDGAGSDGKDNEWYVNTASFYRQIRNIRIDITATDPNAYVCAIHYQVAQATSVQNVELIATTGTTQQGMYSENGSGGFMSDVTFTGGAFGFYGGNQQFTVQRLTFNGCDTAVQIIWDWGWVWKSVSITNSKVGFMLDPGGGDGVIGSVTIMDSVFTDVEKAIVMNTPSNKTNSGTTGVVLDNVKFKGAVTYGVADTKGVMYLGGTLSNDGNVNRWVLGPVYNGTSRIWAEADTRDIIKDATLTGPSDGILPNAPYFERARPQYESTLVSDFVHLKELGAKGDGVTDDTEAVQAAFNTYGNSDKVILADAGVYILTDTVIIPVGTKIVGEAWTQFAAYGANFQDAREPRVMLQVGNDGDSGSVEMQDLLFTTKGPTPGAILVQWNIQANAQGSAALWDCHARLGGATGTSLTPTECPAYSDGTALAECMTAALVMHLTYNSSGYFENMWLWTADHMLDDPDLIDDKNAMTQISVFTARGMLIESQTATWMYATASEHAVLYQFNFNSAAHVFGGLLQTESPYYQPTPKPPAPFTSSLGIYDSDPYYNCGNEFDGCDSSWAIIMYGSQDIHLAALGVYSWFDDYTQDCIDLHTCQKALIYLQHNFDNVRLEQVITIGANTSIVVDGVGIPALDNLAVSNNHASWSQISVFDIVSTAVTDDEDDEDDDTPTCDWSLQYDTLDSVQDDLDNVGEFCASVYAIQVLGDMLGEALDNFTDTANGYDDKFNAYVKYIKEIVPLQIDACMNWTFVDDASGPCNQYFTCVYDSGDGKGPSTACPPPGLDFYSNPSWELYYTLVNETGFYAELESTYGIIKDWVTFGTKDTPIVCPSANDYQCPPEDKVQNNYPIPATTYTVPNPKDIFTNASNNFQAIYDGLGAMYMSMMSGGWNGSVADATSVMVLPVSLAYQGAQAMQQVVVIGGEEESREKKDLILEILGAVLMVIPFAGELLSGAGELVAAIGRIISIIGAVGNAGLSIYEIIQDPSSAPMEIIGILMGGIGADIGRGFGRGSAEIKTMADARVATAEGDIAKLGDEFQANDAIIQKISGVCNK